jgi:hypothetical protein
METVTKSFLGSPSTWPGVKVELDDLHDLWGGRCITVYGDGTAFVKMVDLSQSAEIYRLHLEEGCVPQLFETLLRNDVLALETIEREADQDKICTRLSITNSDGETRSICHWDLAAADQRFEDVRSAISYLHDHMGDLGARLIAAVAPIETDEATTVGDAESNLDHSLSTTNLGLMPDALATGGETRSALRALQAVAQFFTEDEWSFEQMPDRPILRLPFQGKEGRWNCYAQIRVTRDVEQILFYSVLPLNVPVDKLPAIAEFITRANYGMALGNFELDFNDGEVRYKTSVDVTETEITGSLLRPLIYTNVLMMDRYMSGLMAVVYAGMSPAEAVKQIEG